MLSTHDRQLFLEAIRPPDGFELDHLIGTTYSLDLVTLLTVPLAFTLFDWQDSNGEPQKDPLILLEALRRNAGRLNIFCQAGQIYVPKQHRGMFAYLENSVTEVLPPHSHGVFHPKVWIGRYVRKNERVKYKVLVQSRNLTFDRSWDVIVSLDGEVQDRKNAFAKNHPLGDFVKALPKLSVRKLERGLHNKLARDRKRD